MADPSLQGAAEIFNPLRPRLMRVAYRMLGSLQDAEDALQDTLLAAWQGLGGFEGRASIRTWLYRIATNRCLDALRAASRRPAKEWDIPGVDPPEPTRLGEVVWLEPYPDVLLDDAMGVPLGPEARYEQTESISLAFVTALQVLPPRQLAVLVLRDVLGFHANEVAEMLDSTVESVTSALKRARASLEPARSSADEREPAPTPDSPSERALVAEFVRAYESADLDAVVALLTDDVFVSMPPPFGWLLVLPADPPRNRPVRPHPHRRPDLRHDPLREQRLPMVRATALASTPVAQFPCRPTPDLPLGATSKRCEVPLLRRAPDGSRASFGGENASVSDGPIALTRMRSRREVPRAEARTGPRPHAAVPR